MLRDQVWLSVGGWITFALTSVGLLLALRRPVLPNQSRLARVGTVTGPLATLLLAVAMILRLQGWVAVLYVVSGGILAIVSLGMAIRRARYE